MIIDTRDSAHYLKQHIKGSINLHNQRIQDYITLKPEIQDRSQLTVTHLSEMLGHQEKAKFSNRKRCFCFLVLSEKSLPKTFMNELRKAANVDENEDSFQINEGNVKSLIQKLIDGVEEPNSIINALEIYKILQKDRLRELFLMIDGGSRFFARYPFMLTSTLSISDLSMGNKCLSAPIDYDFPHDILDCRLFLGSFNQSEKYSVISDLKITHILNITSECGNVHEDKGIKYMKVSIADEDDKSIHPHFENAYQFIDETLRQDKNNNILVHCAMGKSRSATMIIMYIMKRFSWSFDKAFAFVKRKREIIEPNDGFVDQLKDFEKNKFMFASSCNVQMLPVQKQIPCDV